MVPVKFGVKFVNDGCRYSLFFCLYFPYELSNLSFLVFTPHFSQILSFLSPTKFFFVINWIWFESGSELKSPQMMISSFFSYCDSRYFISWMVWNSFTSSSLGFQCKWVFTMIYFCEVLKDSISSKSVYMKFLEFCDFLLIIKQLLCYIIIIRNHAFFQQFISVFLKPNQQPNFKVHILDFII